MAKERKVQQLTTQFMVVVAATVLVSLIILGTMIFKYLEDWTWIESLYFTVVTLTTVGYGDLTPTSDASRLTATFFILLGVTVAVSAVGIIGSGYIQKRAVRHNKRHDD